MFVVDDTNTGIILSSESHLATEVDNASVLVIKRQKDTTTGVQLLQGERLSKAALLEEIQIHTEPQI